MVTISKYQAQVRTQASPHAYVHLQDFHYRNGTCIRHLTNALILLLSIMNNSGITLAKDLNTLMNKSVLTVDSDLL